MKSRQSSEAQRKEDGWLAGFLLFCKRNILWIVFCYVLTFAVYGMCFFQNIVTFDAEGLYTRSDALVWYRQWVELGRWALFGLKKILGLFIINPFLSVTICLLLFPFSVLLWGFTLVSWAEASNRGRAGDSIGHYLRTEKIFLFAFGAFYLIQPVWALQFGYRNQMEVISVAMVAMPLAMNSMNDFLQRGGLFPLIVTVLLITACFGCYQSFMFVYAAAACIWMFIYLLGYGEKKQKRFWRKVGWILLITLLSYGLNSMISRAARAYYHIKGNGQYLTNQFMWGKRPVPENIQTVLGYLKQSFFGGKTGTAWFAAGFLFCMIWCIARIVRKKRRAWLQLLLILLLAFIPFALEILTAGFIASRSQFAYVLVLAFFNAVGFCVIGNLLLKNTARWRRSGYLFAGIAMALFVLIVPTLNRTTRLMYTQVRTLNSDYSEFQAIYYEALAKGAKEGDAVCFVGGKGNQVDESMVEYEQMGFSYMETITLGGAGDSSNKAAGAMSAMGLRVSKPTHDQQLAAEQIAKDMDCWPSGADSIRVEDGYFVVKLA